MILLTRDSCLTRDLALTCDSGLTRDSAWHTSTVARLKPDTVDLAIQCWLWTIFWAPKLLVVWGVGHVLLLSQHFPKACKSLGPQKAVLKNLLRLQRCYTTASFCWTRSFLIWLTGSFYQWRKELTKTGSKAC